MLVTNPSLVVTTIRIGAVARHRAARSQCRGGARNATRRKGGFCDLRSQNLSIDRSVRIAPLVSPERVPDDFEWTVPKSLEEASALAILAMESFNLSDTRAGEAHRQ